MSAMRWIWRQIRNLAVRGTGSWKAGVSFVVVGMLSLIPVLILGGFGPLPEWVSWASYLSGSIFTLGAMFIWARFEKLHAEEPYFTVVKVAQLGYLLWFSGTVVAVTVGLVIGLGQANGLLLITTFFSFLFLCIGANMAGSPRRGWPLRSLLLLKRIANWQLGSAAAILAFGLVAPGSEVTVNLLPSGLALPSIETNTNLFAGLPENFAHLLRLLLVWVFCSAAMTVLLEPLKYKLEALPQERQHEWENGEIK